MKIQLDTTNKLITVEEAINLKELKDLMKTMLPDGLWKEFSIQSAVINNWTDPWIWRYPYHTTYPQPFPWITCDAITSGFDTEVKLTSGIYNIEA